MAENTDSTEILQKCWNEYLNDMQIKSSDASYKAEINLCRKIKNIWVWRVYATGGRGRVVCQTCKSVEQQRCLADALKSYLSSHIKIEMSSGRSIDDYSVTFNFLNIGKMLEPNYHLEHLKEFKEKCEQE
jgi:hypothetical protein